MAEMRTDTAALAQEASNFERIAADLKQEIDHVSSVAASLQPTWQGAAGQEAQRQFATCVQVSTDSKSMLERTLEQLRNTGMQYSTADEAHQQTMSADMGF